MQQFEIRIQSAFLETQADPVEDNDDSFKSLQSDLDELKLLNTKLVPDGTIADDFTDADQTLSLAKSATIDDQEILNHYQQSHGTFVISGNDDEEFREDPRHLKRPSRQKIFAALELLQN